MAAIPLDSPQDDFVMITCIIIISVTNVLIYLSLMSYYAKLAGENIGSMYGNVHIEMGSDGVLNLSY